MALSWNFLNNFLTTHNGIIKYYLTERMVYIEHQWFWYWPFYCSIKKTTTRKMGVLWFCNKPMELSTVIGSMKPVALLLVELSPKFYSLPGNLPFSALTADPVNRLTIENNLSLVAFNSSSSVFWAGIVFYFFFVCRNRYVPNNIIIKTEEKMAISCLFSAGIDFFCFCVAANFSSSAIAFVLII
jgi:hypothetical protein